MTCRRATPCPTGRYNGLPIPARCSQQLWASPSEHRTPESTSVLIVEDEQSIRDILVELFEVEGTAITAVGTLSDAQQALSSASFDLIVTDIRLGGKRDGGLQVMATAGLLSPDAAVIVLTAYPDDDNRHASLRLGATHFLEKPVDLTTIAALAAQHGVASAIFPVAASR